MLKLILIVFGCLLITMGVLAQDVPAAPTFTDLDSGWNRIPAEAPAVCALGDPYAFFVRPGSESHVTIYFEGGGACWDYGTCSPDGFSTYYKQDVGTLERNASGIFDFENPANPIVDDTVVFVPYCSADVFSGSQTVTYSSPDGNDLVIEHRGFANASVALNWAFANLPDAERVLVTGSSAGALGALYHGHRVMAAYPSAQVTLISDGYAGIVPDDWAGPTIWGTYANLPQATGDTEVNTMTDLVEFLYTYTATTYPDQTIGQYTTVFDEVQAFFYQLMALGAEDMQAGNDLVSGMRALARLRAGQDLVFAGIQAQDAALSALPNYHVYLAGGGEHTAFARDLFYTIAVDGVPLRDWVAALLAEQPAERVVCFETADGCDTLTTTDD
ncbi:MAG: hypothetical protein GYB67_03340 [Chloroflexi bacterium]|nr:hypothetical protein [Chloroflexota bacterium]